MGPENKAFFDSPWKAARVGSLESPEARNTHGMLGSAGIGRKVKIWPPECQTPRKTLVERDRLRRSGMTLSEPLEVPVGARGLLFHGGTARSAPRSRPEALQGKLGRGSPGQYL
jgi:hypothetical protein